MRGKKTREDHNPTARRRSQSVVRIIKMESYRFLSSITEKTNVAPPELMLRYLLPDLLTVDGLLNEISVTDLGEGHGFGHAAGQVGGGDGAAPPRVSDGLSTLLQAGSLHLQNQSE